MKKLYALLALVSTVIVAGLVTDVGALGIILCIASIGSVPAALVSMHQTFTYDKLYGVFAFMQKRGAVNTFFSEIKFGLQQMMDFKLAAAYQCSFTDFKLVAITVYLKALGHSLYTSVVRKGYQLSACMKQHFGGVYSGAAPSMASTYAAG